MSSSRGRTATRRSILSTGLTAVTAAALVVAGAPGALASTPPDYAPQAESPAVTSPAPAPLALDTFARAVSGGWGSAPTGGAWTMTGGSPGDYAVADGTARMTIRDKGWQLSAALADVRSTDTDVRATLALDKAPVGGSVDLDVTGRAVDATQGYRLRSKVLADGRIRASLVSVAGSTTRTLASTNLSGVPVTGGRALQVRLEVTGTGTTSLHARLWATGAPEPADWQLSATDSTAALQRPGGIALTGYTSSSLTNAPMTALFSGLQARTPDGSGTAPTPAPGPVGTYVPDATTTGVPAGTALQVHDGDLVVSTPGAVIDGLDVHGFVKVTAPDVTIRNSIVRGRATSKQTALITSATPGASVTVEDSELFDAAPGPWVDGVRGYGFTLRRVNLHDVIDMAHVYGDDVTIEASYLHDNLHYDVDPAQKNSPSHDDSIQIQKGNRIQVVGNDISGAYNTGIQFTQDQGTVSDVTIDRNHLDGGGCTINLAEKGRGPFQGITITNNVFGRTTKHANCAIISPVTTKPVTSGNYFVDGAVATVRKG